MSDTDKAAAGMQEKFAESVMDNYEERWDACGEHAQVQNENTYHALRKQ